MRQPNVIISQSGVEAFFRDMKSGSIFARYGDANMYMCIVTAKGYDDNHHTIVAGKKGTVCLNNGSLNFNISDDMVVLPVDRVSISTQ